MATIIHSCYSYYIVLCLYPYRNRRIHITFRGTAYKLSKLQYWTFGTVIILVVVSTISWAVSYYLLGRNDFFTIAISLALMAPMIFLYVSVAICTSCMFQQKLLHLAKMQSSSSADVTEIVQLNNRQQTLIAVASYVDCIQLLVSELHINC